MKNLQVGVASIALFWWGQAFAQEMPDQPGADASGAEETLSLEQVTVQAQRRSERLVDVPISVSTASPADLELAGPESIENLTKITPGIYLQRASYGLSPTIRGVGSTLAASSGEQNVGLYVDEIYYPTPTGNIFDLASVESVAVLKGPQGTLFGRNATGGAILVRTLDPDFTPAGRFNISYERFDQLRTSGYLNMPVNDKVAVNASLAYRKSEGYVEDLMTGEKTDEGENFTARGKLLYQPNDVFSLVLTVAHAEFSDPSGTGFRALQPAPLVQALGGGVIATDRYDSSYATKQEIETTFDEYSARARWDIWGGTLSSFTAYLKNDLVAVTDLTGSYVPYSLELSTNTDTFTQEVNFASDDSQPFSYVVGVYYFKNEGGLPYAIQNGDPLFFNKYDDWSASVYADGTYTFGNWSLIAGLRYTYEEISADTGFGATMENGTYTRFQEDEDGQLTPRLGLRYALNDNSNIYATYSRGYKSGRFDRSSPTGPGVDAETVDAFEVGFKTATGNYTFNTAAFYYDYSDTQVNATITMPGGAIVTELFNAPKSEIYGLEADTTIRLSDNFDLSAAAAYTHARYEDFPFAPGYVVDPTDPATLGGLLFSNVSVDASGNHMVRSPELTASGTLSYHTPIGSNKELVVTLSPYYSSEVYFTFDNSLSQDAYTTLDAAATLTVNDNLSVSIFGRNLTDSDHKVGAGQNSLSFENATFAKPRTYGVSLGLSF